MKFFKTNDIGLVDVAYCQVHVMFQFDLHSIFKEAFDTTLFNS